MQVDTTEQQAVVERRFLAAVRTGDVQALLDVLAPDVVVVADGGGIAAAVRRPVTGADRVARLLAGFAQVAPDARLGTTWVNGSLAVRLDLDGELHGVVSLVVDGGRVARIYAVNNPEKLGRLQEPAPLSK